MVSSASLIALKIGNRIMANRSTDPTPQAPRLPNRKATFFAAVGADIRDARIAAGLAQQDLSDLFGWGRDAVSKIERGVNTLTLFEYLELMQFLRDQTPGHPAHDLRAYFEPKRSAVAKALPA